MFFCECEKLFNLALDTTETALKRRCCLLASGESSAYSTIAVWMSLTELVLEKPVRAATVSIDDSDDFRIEPTNLCKFGIDLCFGLWA